MAKPAAPVSITILNWDKYNPRKDVKNSSWFRLEHSLFEDPEFYDLSHSQLLFWVYLLTNASKKNGPTFNLNLAHAERVGRFKPSDIQDALEILQAIQCIHVDVTDTSRERNADVTATNATNERTNERDETNGDLAFSPKDLFALWNAGRGALPEAEKLTEKRKTLARNQIKLYPEPDHWALAIKKFSESKFCVDTWRPGFDDLLTESTRIKAIEGKYDERAKMSVVSSDQAWENSAGLVVSALKKYANWLESEHDVQTLLGNELFTLARKANTTELRKIPAGPFHIQNIIKRLQDAQERAG